MTLHDRAVIELADLERAGVDFQVAVTRILYRNSTYAVLFHGMDADEKFYEADALSLEASEYNDHRPRRHGKRKSV